MCVKNKEEINISIFDNQTSIINQRRAINSYVAITEPVKISSGWGSLRENPNLAAGVVITNGSTTYSICNFNQGQQPAIGVISIDYDQAIIYGLSDVEGLTLTASYQGMGAIFLNASRVATKISGNAVTQTLDTVVAKASSFQSMGTYNNTTTYNIFNIVLYLGTSYICNVSTSTGNLPTNPAFWNKIAGTTYRGVYDSTVSYNSSDYVLNATSDVLYVSIVDGNIGQALTNTAKWTPTISVASMTAAETSRVSSENTRINSEINRTNSENTRISQENARVTSEGTRSSSETNRSGNEATRQSQETTRQSQETTRQTAINNLAHLGAWSSTTAYQLRNVVSQSGSSYMCILAHTNQSPTNTTYWQLAALKGTDGAGAGTVTSVTPANADLSVATGTTTPVLTINASVSATPNSIIRRNSNGDIPDVLKTQDIFNDFVVTGLLPPTSANLTSITTTGSAYIISQRVTKSATSNTYTASSDIYVDLDMNGTYTYITLANNAAIPAITANSIRLFKVVTNVSAVTSVTDLRALIPTAPVAAFQEMFPSLTSVNFNGLTVGNFVLSRSLVTLGTITLA